MDPLSIQTRIQEVIEVRSGCKDSGDRDPAEELISEPLRAAEEADSAQAVEQRHKYLQREHGWLGVKIRPYRRLSQQPGGWWRPAPGEFAGDHGSHEQGYGRTRGAGQR